MVVIGGVIPARTMIISTNTVQQLFLDPAPLYLSALKSTGRAEQTLGGLSHDRYL